MKRRVRIPFGWTCCDLCHTVHRNLLTARLHWMWLRAAQWWKTA